MRVFVRNSDGTWPVFFVYFDLLQSNFPGGGLVWIHYMECNKKLFSFVIWLNNVVVSGGMVVYGFNGQIAICYVFCKVNNV